MSERPFKRARRSVTPDYSTAGLVDNRRLPDDLDVPDPTAERDEASVAGKDASTRSSSPELELFPPRQRVSLYLEAFEEMLTVVLGNERYLFSEVELEALDSWQTMSYEARYLFVRLFLRKNGWFRVSSLSYERDISDMRAACVEICTTIAARSAPSSLASSRSSKHTPKRDVYDVDAKETMPSVDPLSGQKPDMLGVSTEHSHFGMSDLESGLRHFAWDDTKLLEENNIDDIVTMLNLDELKAIAKELKLNKAGTTRDSIIRNLKASSSTQTTLSSALSNGRSKSREPSPIMPLRQLGLNFDEQGRHLRQGTLLAASLLRRTGSCIRLCPAILSLFARLHLIFHRSISFTDKALTASVLARFKKRNYPSYTVKRSFAIFEDRDRLLEYEEALRVERCMEECMGEAPDTASGWITDRAAREAGLREGKRVFDRVWPVWQRFVDAEHAKSTVASIEPDQDDRLDYYRKRFHPAWPLTRVVYKGAQILAKLHEYDREAEVLKALLDQPFFRRGKRGAWYERLALVVMHHLGGDKQLRRRQSRKLCMAGLSDPWTHLIFYNALQRRIVRLESALQMKSSRRHTFDLASLRTATKRTLEGEKLSEGLTGKKSSWRAHDGAEVTVEAFSLEFYERHKGYKGFHSENGILTTIFTLLFWDILFAPIDGVFEHAYQAAPLDLASDAFSIVRAEQVNRRLSDLEGGQGPSILAEVDARERQQKTWAVGVRWDYTAEDISAIVDCLGGKALAAICRVYAEEWGHRVGGVPDLCLWHPVERRCLFVEVKGPGDRLSDTQRVWIDVLLAANVPVELCSVRISGEDVPLSDDEEID